MRFTHILMLVVLFTVHGCTLARFDDVGTTVRLFAEADVQQCARLGFVQANIRRRNVAEEDVPEQLTANARQQAARLGGDTIVEEGPRIERTQTFVVYRCQPDRRKDSSVIGLEIEKAI